MNAAQSLLGITHKRKSETSTSGEDKGRRRMSGEQSAEDGGGRNIQIRQWALEAQELITKIVNATK